MKKSFEQGMTLGKIPNQEIYGQLLDYAKSKDVPIYYGSSADNFDAYPNITFDSNNQLCGNYANYGDTGRNWITFEQFFEYCDNWEDNQPVKIKLNSEYTAEIINGKVKVGCQTFEFDAIKKLYNAIKNTP